MYQYEYTCSRYILPVMRFQQIDFTCRAIQMLPANRFYMCHAIQYIQQIEILPVRLYKGQYYGIKVHIFLLYNCIVMFICIYLMRALNSRRGPYITIILGPMGPKLTVKIVPGREGAFIIRGHKYGAPIFYDTSVCHINMGTPKNGDPIPIITVTSPALPQVVRCLQLGFLSVDLI